MVWTKSTAWKKNFPICFFRYRENGESFSRGKKEMATFERRNLEARGAGKCGGSYCWYRKITTARTYFMIPLHFFFRLSHRVHHDTLLNFIQWNRRLFYSLAATLALRVCTRCRWRKAIFERICLLFYTMRWRKIAYSLRIWKMNMH